MSLTPTRVVETHQLADHSVDLRMPLLALMAVVVGTGGAIGSLFAQCFYLSAAGRKTLLVAGAAAGMTAIFGTPLAAILLAVEVLLFEWKPRSFVPVVVAAIVSLAWRPLFLGS